MTEVLRSVIDDIKRHEGYRGMPYEDTLGNWTIGYGTKLPLDKVESELLLEKRLNEAANELVSAVPSVLNLPTEAQAILFNMAYNMGVPKLLGFKKMFAALDEEDYEEAARQMLDSRWHLQVRGRAEELAERMRRVA